MTVTGLISIDPGMSTGLVFGTYSDTEPYERTAFFQLEGGIKSLVEVELDLRQGYAARQVLRAETRDIISERFTPRPLVRSYKSAELEPLRIEGWLMANELMPYNYKDKKWRSPQSLVLRRGNTPAESKKLSDDLLREHGLWLTGKQVGCKDANDAISATKHALAYLKSIGHEPTIRKYWT